MTAAIAQPHGKSTAPVAASRWPIFDRSLRDRRRSLVSWSAGIGAYVGLIVVFWPSIRGSSEISKAIANYPDAMKEFFGGAAAFDYTRAGGFLNTQLFSFILPLLIAAFAMGYGASTIAGEQQSGQLDLLVALPITRARIVREKATAIAVAVAALALFSALVIVGVGALVDLNVATSGVAAACLGAGLVALLHGFLALAVGAATGSRATALGVSSAAFVLGYLIQALSGLVDAIKPLRAFSALYHANGSVPINTGFPVLHHLLLAALCAILGVLAVHFFARRDLS